MILFAKCLIAAGLWALFCKALAVRLDRLREAEDERRGILLLRREWAVERVVLHVRPGIPYIAPPSADKIRENIRAGVPVDAPAPAHTRGSART